MFLTKKKLQLLPRKEKSSAVFNAFFFFQSSYLLCNVIALMYACTLVQTKSYLNCKSISERTLMS